MNIGRLDRKIVIESPSLSKNGLGESIASSWSTYHTCFASITKVRGDEKNEADKITATNVVKFTIRFFDGINENMRILYDSNYYDIHEIQELRRVGLVIKASKKYG